MEWEEGMGEILTRSSFRSSADRSSGGWRPTVADCGDAMEPNAGRQCWQDWGGLEEVTEVMEGIAMGGVDWKKFPNARASGARRIYT